MFLVKRAYFNKTNIIKGLIIALSFSAFIYLAYFDYINRTLNSVLGLFSLYLILTANRKTLFFAGFFIGMLWFYWIGISMQYYNLSYLNIPVVLFFGLVYGLLFLVISISKSTLYRVIVLYLFSYIQPFGFNWFIPELIFIDSWFPVGKEYFAVILASVYMMVNLNKNLKVLALIPLFIIYVNKGVYIDNPKIEISMPQLNVNQDRKWQRDNLASVLENNFKLINQAILEDKDLIILPETAFPMVINKDSFTSYNLLDKSKYIDIITGGIYVEDQKFYNATYFFSKGEMKIAKKVVLVPFGEKIPLPKIMVDFINKIFFNGAEDYVSAETPTNFDVAGIKFRNAICYEATTDKIYENLEGANYAIAISNNAWFTPSIEPTLQKLLLKYYAKKYKITIFHSINGSKNYIIRP
jgi:apolipoprotein N-acyltransferase